ncbi:MAG: hypothetical protein HY452_00515 [Parcubacteria group bacterium]|nr:hypothetical protein [Parcubacteria group bacterium]
MLKLFTVFILLLATPVFVGAQTGGSIGSGSGGSFGDSVTIENPLPYNSIPEVINRIIDFLALLAAPIAVLMLVGAAYLFVFGGLNENNVKKAKSIILYVVVGLMVLGLSKAIVSVTLSVLNTPAPPP